MRDTLEINLANGGVLQIDEADFDRYASPMADDPRLQGECWNVIYYADEESLELGNWANCELATSPLEIFKLIKEFGIDLDSEARAEISNWL